MVKRRHAPHVGRWAGRRTAGVPAMSLHEEGKEGERSALILAVTTHSDL